LKSPFVLDLMAGASEEIQASGMKAFPAKVGAAIPQFRTGFFYFPNLSFDYMRFCVGFHRDSSLSLNSNWGS